MQSTQRPKILREQSTLHARGVSSRKNGVCLTYLVLKGVRRSKCVCSVRNARKEKKLSMSGRPKISRFGARGGDIERHRQFHGSYSSLFLSTGHRLFLKRILNRALYIYIYIII